MRRTHRVGKALILGADSRSGLATIRSLGRGGIEVHAASHRDDFIAFRSRYVRKTYLLPAYTRDSSEWKSALSAIMARERFDLVIPTNDMWVTALQRRRLDFERLSRLYLLSDDAFEILFDKVKTNQLARSLGIPVPEEALISRVEDVAGALSVCGLPVVLKPIRSLDEREGGPRRVVSQAFSEAEAVRQASAMLQAGPIAAQRYFVGHGVGVEMLLRDGEPLLTFQHERVHESFGSGSSYRKGVAPSAPLVDASLRLLQRVQYTGVAMVEFRVNPDTGEWILLEVNARFWGSLPLALASGVDFPLALYRMLTGGGDDFALARRMGLYCRNLTMDLPWYREFYHAAQLDRGSLRRPLLRDIVQGASNVARFRERIDTLVADDPAPFVAEFAHLGATYSKRVGALLRRR